MGTAQLALGLVLRFADQGSSAARSALDGVQRALDGVRQRSVGAADAAQRAASNLGTLDSSGRRASAAADAAAKSLGKIGDTRAAEGAARVAQEANAATQALNKMGQAAEQAASKAKAGPARDASGSFLPRGQSGYEGGPGGTTPSAGSRAEAAVNAGRGLMGGMYGYMAGKAVLQAPVAQTMSYDRRLAHLANTGSPDGSLAERRALMKEMDGQIMAAVRAGGGTREGAMDTLDRLVASGAYKSPQDAMKDLPALVKFGGASGADPGELADIAVKARQSMGITDFSGALDKAMRAGQLGGFELKDQAKWLPQQMAAAKLAGLSGDKDLAVLLAANQASAVTAGSKDEAGNNLVNLLAKISSQDTAADAKKLGINLTGSLAAARAKGVNSLDAFVNIAEQVVAKDPKFVELQKKAASAKGPEQKAMYSDMAAILQGSSIGKIVQDRQALMALVGLMQQRTTAVGDNTAEMRQKINDAKGTGDRAFDLISETPSYKAEMLAAEKANAMQQALNQVNPLLGKMADWLSGVAKDYPVFTAATVSSTTALFALAAAAGAASLSQMLSGGKGGIGGAASGILGRLTAAAGSPVGMVLGAGATGYGIGMGIDYMIDGTKTKDVIGEIAAMLTVAFGPKDEAEKAARALVERQIEAADKLKEAAKSLNEAKPVVALDMAQLDRDIQNYQNAEARRR